MMYVDADVSIFMLLKKFLCLFMTHKTIESFYCFILCVLIIVCCWRNIVLLYSWFTLSFSTPWTAVISFRIKAIIRAFIRTVCHFTPCITCSFTYWNAYKRTARRACISTAERTLYWTRTFFLIRLFFLFILP